MNLKHEVGNHPTGNDCQKSGLQGEPNKKQGPYRGADHTICPTNLNLRSQVNSSQHLVGSLPVQALQESGYSFVGITFSRNDLLLIFWGLLNSLLLSWTLWVFLTLPTAEGSPRYTDTPVEQYLEDTTSDRPDPEMVGIAQDFLRIHGHVSLHDQRQCPWWKVAYPAAYEKAMQDSMSIHRIMGLNNVNVAGRAGRND